MKFKKINALVWFQAALYYENNSCSWGGSYAAVMTMIDKASFVKKIELSDKLDCQIDRDIFVLCDNGNIKQFCTDGHKIDKIIIKRPKNRKII